MKILDLRPTQRVSLTRAPLVTVISQVRFSDTPGLVDGPDAEAVRAALKADYPESVGEQHKATLQRADGTVETHEIHQWTLSSVDGNWRVTIAGDFIAIQTMQYTNREDFLTRFSAVLDAVPERARPAVVHRLGVRYVDRLTGAGIVDRLSEYIRPELCAAVVDRDESVRLLGQAVQTTLAVEDDEVLLRSFVLPPQGFYDVMILPVNETAWVLDIDAYTTRQFGYVAAEILDNAHRLVERVYSAFRWVVTDKFLGEHA